MNYFSSRFAAAVLATATLALVGCSGGKNYSLAPVTGKVTCNEAPVAGVRLVFSPKSVGENHVVGPWSTGVTDDQGVYFLKTRYNEDGAATGMHDVSFEYDDGDTDQLDELMEDLDAAKDPEDGSAEEVNRLKKEIEDLKQKIKSRPKTGGAYTMDVPKGGTKEANFELPMK